jgi:hypothetical protein
MFPAAGVEKELENAVQIGNNHLCFLTDFNRNDTNLSRSTRITGTDRNNRAARGAREKRCHRCIVAVLVATLGKPAARINEIMVAGYRVFGLQNCRVAVN